MNWLTDKADRAWTVTTQNLRPTLTSRAVRTLYPRPHPPTAIEEAMLEARRQIVLNMARRVGAAAAAAS